VPPAEPLEGWAWLEAAGEAVDLPDEICRSAVTCLGGSHGRVLLRHLQRRFLDRRIPPTAADAELRHAEGQRSVVAHLLQLLERGRGEARALTPQRLDQEATP
jgi:hypothetical protein